MNATTLGPRTVRAASSQLDVERTGIRFWNPAPDRVRIEVEVHNRGDGWSAPERIALEAAAFGAFLPWRPLAQLQVPPIAPWGSAIVSTEVPHRRARPVTDFSGVIPPRLLTAVGAGDAQRPERPATRLQQRRAGLMLMALMTRLGRTAGPRTELPPGLFELLGDGSPHWAGNINVLIGNQEVERHMARSLRMHPGRANIAMFLLGGGARYTLRVEGDAARWGHDLYDGAGGGSLLQPEGTFHLEAGRSFAPVFFVCRPPASCARGTAEVHVERHPKGERAVVEFSLEADAAGPGCYSV